MTGLALAAVLGLAGVVGLVILDVVIRRVEIGVALVLGVFAIRIALPGVFFGVSLGSFNVFVADAVFTIILAAAVARCLRLRRWTVSLRLLLLIVVLCVLSLARGVTAFGVQAAVNEFRPFLGYFGMAAYCATFNGAVDRLDRVAKVFVAAAAMVGVAVLIRWAGVLTGVQPDLITASYDAPIRVLSGPQTFFLAHALFFLMPQWLDKLATPWQRRLAAVLLVMVTLLNRRTVWLAMLGGFVVLVLRRRGLGGSVRPLLALAAVVGAVVFFSLPDTTAGPQDVAQSAVNTNTFSWRVEGWVSLLTDNGPAKASEWLLGRPMGSGYEREVLTGQGQLYTVDSSPHSFYLQTLLRTGLVGVAAMSAVLGIALRNLLPTRWSSPVRLAAPGRLLTQESLFILVLMQVIWFATWQAGDDQGVVTGLAAAASWRSVQDRQTSRIGL